MNHFEFDAVKSAKVLRHLRNRHGLLQEELADALGYERSKISSIESARWNLTIEGYVRYLDYFRSKGEKITLEDLVRGTMPDDRVAYQNKPEESPEDHAVMKASYQHEINFMRHEIHTLLQVITSLTSTLSGQGIGGVENQQHSVNPSQEG